MKKNKNELFEQLEIIDNKYYDNKSKLEKGVGVAEKTFEEKTAEFFSKDLS